MKINYKGLAIALLLAFSIGAIASGNAVKRSDRPFLRALSGAAKLGLKLLVFMEPPPPAVEYKRHELGENYVDHHRSL